MAEGFGSEIVLLQVSNNICNKVSVEPLLWTLASNRWEKSSAAASSSGIVYSQSKLENSSERNFVHVKNK